MIDYNKLTQRAYDCAVKRGQVTEETTVSEILCDCMGELAEAWEAHKRGLPMRMQKCVEYSDYDYVAICDQCREECEEFTLEGVAVELADVVICLMTLAHKRKEEIMSQEPNLVQINEMQLSELVAMLFHDISGMRFADRFLGLRVGVVITAIEQWLTARDIDIFEAVLVEKMAYNERREA